MKTVKNRKATTIYIQLLLLFFLTIIPFFALGLFANHVAEVRLREQSEERLATQLENMTTSYEDLHFRVYSWMKVNLMTDYKVLLGNSNVELSAYKLGAYVSDLFSSLQELAQMSDDILDIAVYMPRTGRVVSLLNYYDNTLSADVLERIEAYKETRNAFTYQQDAIRIFSLSSQSKKSKPLYVTEITLSSDLLLSHLNEHAPERYALLLWNDFMLAIEEDASLLQEAKARIAANGDASGRFVLNNHLFIYRQFLKENYYIGYVPLDVLLAPVKSFDSLTIGTLALALLASVIVSLSLSRTINRPFRSLVEVFQQVEQGNIGVSLAVQPGMPNEFAIVYNRFNDMIAQINDLMNQRVEQEKALEQAKYRELQAHIAPHFLYNSFNVLRHSILMGDDETAARMTKLLASYFKYLTYKGEQTTITLEEEYRHMLDYLEIQKIRFRDSIIVEIAPLPDVFRNVLVPPFVLQPLVENAFKHGIHDIASGGKITLTIRQETDELHLIVRDNGVGMPPDALNALREAILHGRILTEHSGLINISQRLKLHSGGSSRVEVDSRQDEYFEARICLSGEKTEGTHTRYYNGEIFPQHTRDDSPMWVQNICPQNIFFCLFLLSSLSPVQTHRAKQLQSSQNPSKNSPNCAYLTHFPLKKAN